jgi:hypothetical protein
MEPITGPTTDAPTGGAAHATPKSADQPPNYAIVPHELGPALLLTPVQLQVVFLRWAERCLLRGGDGCDGAGGDGCDVADAVTSRPLRGKGVPSPHIPDDVVALVASFVPDARTLAAMGAVCTSWRDALGRDALWTPHLDAEFGVHPAGVRVAVARKSSGSSTAPPEATAGRPRADTARLLFSMLATSRAALLRGDAFRRQAARVMGAAVAPPLAHRLLAGSLRGGLRMPA